MFLDIGFGILLAIAANSLFAIPLTPLFVLTAAGLTLAPDIDFLIELAKHGSAGGTVIREHRELTHFPLPCIALVILVFIVFGSSWSFLLGAGLVFHFLHDSVGIGWGIKWLWPFSKKSYKFFAGKNGRCSSRLLVSWEANELEKVVSEYGDPHWIKNIYLRPTFVSVSEFFGFIVSLIVLYLYIKK